MKKFFLYAIAALAFLVSCTEEVDTSSRYVFKEETISSYLEKHAQYSEYYRLLNEVLVSNISETKIMDVFEYTKKESDGEDKD